MLPEKAPFLQHSIVSAIPHCIPCKALLRRSTMNRVGILHWLENPRRLVAAATCLTIMVTLCLTGLTCEAARGDSRGTPSQIPAILTKKGRNLTALKAVMTVKSTYDGGKSRQDLKGFLMYRRPSDFRFQGVGPGGNSLFELVIKKMHFELFIPAEAKLIRGGKKCFGRKFPDVAEIETLIPIALLQWKNVRFDRVVSSSSDKVIVRVTCDGRTWGATLDPEKLLLKRLVRLGPNGKIDLTADFGDFGSGEYGWLPRRFEVRSPRGQWRTIVRIIKMETNPFLVEKNFRLEPAFSPKIEQCR